MRRTTTDKDPSRIPWGSQTEDGQVLLSMPWEVFVLGVALLSITNLVLAIVVPNPDTAQVITIVDSLLLVVFLVDFARRMIVAEDNRAYFVRGYGWLDLLSIVPFLRVARLLRIARIIRILQRMGGLQAALRAFFVNKAAGGLYIVVIMALLVLEFGSLLVLWAERGAEDANILTAGDAVWYSLVTMSTVGYGDHFPVTDLGRLFGSLTIVVGVGVFGTLTGFLANTFLSPGGGNESVEWESDATDPSDPDTTGPDASELEA
jgi:voltage-gated potassium channel Kch